MTARIERAAVTRTQTRTRSRRQPVESLPAPFALRCGAMLIDYIVLVGIVALSTLIARMLGGGARTAASSAETVGLLIALAVAVLNLGVLAGFTGRTIGKWATGLRVRRKDGSEPGVGRAFLRHFVGYPLSFLTLGFGFLLAALSTRGRALHDLIAGTIVVRER
ncbi:MAG TPA: RDD family protein [Pyrinomonadaceae bacterium]|nr:RDD family protein [Pyrinomonadaceae bacterium]